MNSSEPTSSPGVRAVIFDISGTVLDYGSRGPVVAFQELFKRHGTPISSEEARRPMGAHKKDHIRAVLADPEVKGRWEKIHGSAPSEKTVESLYEEFVPLQIEVVKRYSEVIPGVPEVVKQLRGRGIKIANTTGFVRAMIVDLIQLAAKGGYSTDVWVCPDDVGGKGRPAPWMAFHAARQLDVYPMSAIVKVGDTPADVAEAQSAGMWSVATVRSGNEVGYSEEELAALDEKTRAAAIASGKAKLASCKPHYMIDSVADLMPIIDLISARIARGERP
jgi:phosphonoacetaldehyde hydrolase